MSEQEMIDVFDDNMKLIGSRSREDVHNEGLWHQSFHCWILRKDRSKHYVLFQRRGPDKKLYPNTLDITAAGHLLAGETPADGLRELEEELGMKASFKNLISLGIRCDVVKIGNVLNREFCNTFFLESNNPIDTYKLQADEVAGLVQMEIQDGLKLFSNQARSVPVTGFQVDATGVKRKVDIKVAIDDIIPRLDRYYFKIFIMAERYFKGEKFFGI